MIQEKEKKLLVVDDEQVVCESCAKVFEKRGFEVETITDPVQGLDLAAKKNYAAILLDIKMPKINGFDFLQNLREKRILSPIIFITGYPSLWNAQMAEDLGAVDFVTKPFTPQEIITAVNMALLKTSPFMENRPSQQPPKKGIEKQGEPSTRRKIQAPFDTEKFYFKEEAWLQPESEKSVRVGVLLPHKDLQTVRSVQLPFLGDVLYQGFPLALFHFHQKPSLTVPSPITGRVVEVNESWNQDSSKNWGHHCSENWIAKVISSDLMATLKSSKQRDVLLATSDISCAEQKKRILKDLGCRVRVVSNLIEAAEVLFYEKPDSLFFIDANSFGFRGPEVVREINDALPNVRVVVLGNNSQLEKDYRQQKILYYAIEPMDEIEIREIVTSAFLPKMDPLPKGARSSFLPESLHKIVIKNPHSKEVTLLISGEILLRHRGMGYWLCQKILSENLPITTSFGAREFNLIAVLEHSKDCQRLIFLETRDMGRIPGTLVPLRKNKWAEGLKKTCHDFKAFAIQPDHYSKRAFLFDDRISRVVAEFLFSEMVKE